MTNHRHPSGSDGTWPRVVSSPYVAIEAPKGAGKTTCVERVLAALRQEAIDVGTCNPTAEHDPTLFLERIGRWLGHWEPDILRERRYAARACHAWREYTKAELILGDRSVITSLVTRLDPAAPSRTVERVRRLQPGAIRPSLVLTLDAPLDLLLERCAQRTRSYGRVHETAASLQQQREGYRFVEQNARLFGLDGVEFHRVDASLAPVLVAEEVGSLIRRHIAHIGTVRS